MTPVAYLFFNGCAEEALKGYARIFGSPEPQILRAREAPEGEGMPGWAPDAVMHGAVRVGSGHIYASDDPEARPMAGACVTVAGRDEAESRRIFDALAEGGTVVVPLGRTFWSPAFGQVTDRWGTRWLIDTEEAAQG